MSLQLRSGLVVLGVIIYSKLYILIEVTSFNSLVQSLKNDLNSNSMTLRLLSVIDFLGFDLMSQDLLLL